jgi:hypothetical protein
MKTKCYLLGYENFIPPTEYEDSPEAGKVMSDVMDTNTISDECKEDFRCGYRDAENDYKRK